MSTAKSKPKVGLSVQHSVDEAFIAILETHLHALQTWQHKARNWNDIEGVHQMRVALRRLRSALVTFRAAVPRTATAHWGDEMRWCANQLGPARDLDVFISESLRSVDHKLPLAGAEQLRALAENARAEAYQTANALLSSTRYASFKLGLGSWISSQRWREEIDSEQRQTLDIAIVPFAAQQLDKRWRGIKRRSKAIQQDSTPALHELRIECKKLRYATEFFSPLFADMKTFIAHLKKLQEVLGVLNDIAVMQILLDQLLAKHQNAVLLRYAGALIGWRSHEFYQLKDHLPELWREFSSLPKPWRSA